jgi:hypothetical protein
VFAEPLCIAREVGGLDRSPGAEHGMAEGDDLVERGASDQERIH